jgi:hypothetical protein
MKATTALVIVLCLSQPCARAGDAVTLKTGELKPCKVTGSNGDQIFALFEVRPELPASPIRIPHATIARIDFGPDPHRDVFLRDATRAQIGDLKTLWQQFAPLLSAPGSPSGRIGLRLGLLLLDPVNPESTEEALRIFSLVCEQAASQREKESAAQGKLRAWSALGKTAEAMNSAEYILRTQTGPNLRAEAHLTLAENTASALARFLEENPRWELDEAAARERTRLYHSALHAYLLPALFPGITPELGLRGFWGALRLHKACNAPASAADTARDLIALYPATPEAQQAATFLATLPASLREPNATTALRQENDSGPPTPENKNAPYESQNQTVSHQNTMDPSPASTKRRKRSSHGVK